LYLQTVEKVISIGTSHSPETKRRLINVLRTYRKVGYLAHTLLKWSEIIVCWLWGCSYIFPVGISKYSRSMTGTSTCYQAPNRWH